MKLSKSMLEVIVLVAAILAVFTPAVGYMIWEKMELDALPIKVGDMVEHKLTKGVGYVTRIVYDNPPRVFVSGHGGSFDVNMYQPNELIVKERDGKPLDNPEK